MYMPYVPYIAMAYRTDLERIRAVPGNQLRE